MEPEKHNLSNQPPPYTPQQQPVMVYQPEIVHQPVTHMGGPTVMLYPVLGPNPAHVTCPSCRAQIITKTESQTTTKTHLLALLLCVVGCWPCVCIPYCTDSCRTTSHTCPNCNAFLGVQNM